MPHSLHHSTKESSVTHEDSLTLFDLPSYLLSTRVRMKALKAFVETRRPTTLLSKTLKTFSETYPQQPSSACCVGLPQGVCSSHTTSVYTA